MGERIPRPLVWRVVAFIDTSREGDGELAFRHSPQGFVGGHHGWLGVMDAQGRQLTFETPEEAQAWIDERQARHG